MGRGIVRAYHGTVKLAIISHQIQISESQYEEVEAAKSKNLEENVQCSITLCLFDPLVHVSS